MPITGLFSLDFFIYLFYITQDNQCIFGATHSGPEPPSSVIHEEDAQQTYLIAQVLWKLGR